MSENRERWRVRVGTPSIKAQDILVSFTKDPVRIAPSVTAQGGKLPAGTKEYRLMAVKVREPVRPGRGYAVMESRDDGPWDVLRWCSSASEAVEMFYHICPNKPGTIYQSSLGVSARRHAERARERDEAIERATEKAQAAADGIMVSTIAKIKEAEKERASK